MSEMEIRRYGQAKGFHPQTVKRWLGWDQTARDSLLRLAASLKISENHLRDLMDWLEEIALRDRSAIAAILERKPIADIESAPRLGRADKLKRIKEELRRLRFPRLVRLEDSIRERIQELRLHPEICLTVAPGLEGGKLQVEFRASSFEEFEKLTAKLVEVARTNTLRQIFALLAGELPTENP